MLNLSRPHQAATVIAKLLGIRNNPAALFVIEFCIYFLPAILIAESVSFALSATGLNDWVVLFFTWVGMHLPDGLLVLILISLVLGLVGRQMGIPRLFWHESWFTRFISGFSVASVYILILYLSYAGESVQQRAESSYQCHDLLKQSPSFLLIPLLLPETDNLMSFGPPTSLSQPINEGARLHLEDLLNDPERAESDAKNWAALEEAPVSDKELLQSITYDTVDLERKSRDKLPIIGKILLDKEGYRPTVNDVKIMSRYYRSGLELDRLQVYLCGMFLPFLCVVLMGCVLAINGGRPRKPLPKLFANLVFLAGALSGFWTTKVIVYVFHYLGIYLATQIYIISDVKYDDLTNSIFYGARFTPYEDALYFMLYLTLIGLWCWPILVLSNGGDFNELIIDLWVLFFMLPLFYFVRPLIDDLASAASPFWLYVLVAIGVLFLFDKFAPPMPSAGLVQALRRRVWRSLPAATSICAFLAMVGGLAWLSGGAIAFFGYLVPLFILLGIGVTNGYDPYKLTYPGLEEYYDDSTLVPYIYSGNIAASAVAKETASAELKVQISIESVPNATGDSSHVSPPRLLDHQTLLEGWRSVVGGEGGSKPKLVVAATSGGGIAASLWTAKCLVEIEKRFPEFPRHVRLFTGASGGMVGAAYYVASLRTPTEARSDDLLKSIEEDLSRDFLSQIVTQMVFWDIPTMLSPARQFSDRGRVLDEQWDECTRGVLAQPFGVLAQGEAAGWRPTLVISPTILEDGIPLVICNADFSWRTGCVEMFKLFPRALDTLKLSTALRMNAAFPYVSPAVNIPCRPPRRVIDAGYFDNYGVDLAADWVLAHSIWLKENTSGVILIQIRAYPIASTKRETTLSNLLAGYQWMTSPFEGYTIARKRAMVARNDEKVRMLDRFFNQSCDNFFTTLIFEAIEETPLSWTLSAQDRRILESAIKSESNSSQLRKLESLLRSRDVPV